MGLSRKHLFEGLRASLKRLQLEYVDLVRNLHLFCAACVFGNTLSLLGGACLPIRAPRS